MSFGKMDSAVGEKSDIVSLVGKMYFSRCSSIFALHNNARLQLQMKIPKKQY